MRRMKIEICSKGCGALNVMLKFSLENGVSLKAFEQRDNMVLSQQLCRD